MAPIRLVDKEDVVCKSEKKEKIEKEKVVKKKLEKPIVILKIKHHEKLSLPFMKNGKMEKKDIFAVNRGLGDLLRALYYNTQFEKMSPPSDCIYIEKDDRIGANDRYIFINVNKDEVKILKEQLENHLVIYAYNKSEFMILEGRRSYLEEVWNIPRIMKRQ